MYRLVVGAWKIAPSEFWAMSPQEFWWLYDVHRPDRDHVRLRYDRALLDLIGEPLPEVPERWHANATS